MYVAIEGIDRAGKSTQIELLRRDLKNAIFTKEPGGTPFGEKIRKIVLHSNSISPIAEYFLFLADRNEHINKIIKPNLDKLIISDRSYISGVAYAMSKEILPLKELLNLNNVAVENIFPDKIILLELSKEEFLKRFNTQKLDNIEKRGVEYLFKVQQIMRDLIIASKIDYIIIEASKSKEEIFKKILNFIKEENEST
jgi:dTMP kinase